jgi:hypothetical protein
LVTIQVAGGSELLFHASLKNWCETWEKKIEKNVAGNQVLSIPCIVREQESLLSLTNKDPWVQYCPY